MVADREDDRKGEATQGLHQAQVHRVFLAEGPNQGLALDLDLSVIASFKGRIILCTDQPCKGPRETLQK